MFFRLKLRHECQRTLSLLAASLLFASLSGGQREPKNDDRCSVKRWVGLAVRVHHAPQVKTELLPDFWVTAIRSDSSSNQFSILTALFYVLCP